MFALEFARATMRNCEDYRLTIEYKHLKQNAPGGVFVIPSVHHLRIWYGVIFVRRGHYANGVFKFRCVDSFMLSQLCRLTWDTHRLESSHNYRLRVYSGFLLII